MQHKKKRKIKTPGLIYERPDSPYLWIAYSRNGRKYRKSTLTTDEKVAADILKVELGNSVTKPVDPAAINKVTVGDLAAAFLQDYAVSGKSSLADAEARWRLHLEPEFGNRLASQVGTAAINAYRQKRRDEGAALATLNRELAFLKASFRFGIESEPPTVLRCPKIKLPKEKNARQGFFEDGAQHKLYEYCGELWFRGAVEIARVFGWRISEVKGLRVKQADFTDRTLTLYQGETKNGEGRVVTMPRDLCLLLRECAR